MASTSRRQQFVLKELSLMQNGHFPQKHSSSPTSTNASEGSPRDSVQWSGKKPSYRGGFSGSYKPKVNKEKSQLCKKFLENGYCPYQKKCKFAHGSHQLKKNFQTNSKYKTKECDVFVNEGSCIYGERCNFIHKVNKNIQKLNDIDLIFSDIKSSNRKRSKLLDLLGTSEA